MRSGGCSVPEAVGAQWELPGAVARRDKSQAFGIFSRSRPVDGPSVRTGALLCALLGHCEAAGLAMLSEAVRSTRRRFPPSCAPRTFLALSLIHISEPTRR